jgi:CHAP domain
MNIKEIFAIGFTLISVVLYGSTSNATQAVSQVPGSRTGRWIAQHCPNIHIEAKTYGKGSVWRTCNGYTLAFQDDGNLVLYTPSGRAAWATGTEGYGKTLAFQDDGNAVLYDNNNKAIWATNTVSRGRLFALQEDGNLVGYDSSGRPSFQTDTHSGRIGTLRAAYDWGWRSNPTPQPQVSQVNFGAYEFRNGNIFWNAGYAPLSTNPPFSNLGSALGNCTWYANGRAQQLGWIKAKVDKMTGNAGQWGSQAIAAGIRTSRTPQVGAIAQWDSNHVAVVERVNGDGTVVISESSYSPSGPYNYLYNQRTISANNPSRYILP